MTDNPNIIKEALEAGLPFLKDYYEDCHGAPGDGGSDFSFEDAAEPIGIAIELMIAALALIERSEVMYPKYRDTLMDDYSFTKDFITDEPVLVIPLEQSE